MSNWPNHSVVQVANQPRVFGTTHWSIVLAAQADGNAAQALTALDELCRAYWQPLYFYVRRQGHSPTDAEDLIQGFFEELLTRESLRKVAQERGRFRAYLIACLKKFVARQHRRASQAKRGGGRIAFSLDIPDAEHRYGKMLATESDAPDVIYERQWAATLLTSTLESLRTEAEARGQTGVFEHLQCTLSGCCPPNSYGDLAAQLGVSESAVKMAALRLRERFAALFRAALARTVVRPEEIDEELAHLTRVLAG